MHHTTRIPLIHRMMAVMLADHRWSTRRPFEGATRCDKSYVQFLLLSTSVFFFRMLFEEKISLPTYPTGRLSGVRFVRRWIFGSSTLAHWLHWLSVVASTSFSLALAALCDDLLSELINGFSCRLWIVPAICQCVAWKEQAKSCKIHFELHSQSVPNFDSSYYLLLAKFCWLHKLYNLSSHAPAHYLLTSERSAAPSLRFFMGGVMKSGRFVPSSFSPCALTQLPKNMPVAQQAQLVWLHVWRFLTLDGSNYAQSKLYVVS